MSSSCLSHASYSGILAGNFGITRPCCSGQSGPVAQYFTTEHEEIANGLSAKVGTQLAGVMALTGQARLCLLQVDCCGSWLSLALSLVANSMVAKSCFCIWTDAGTLVGSCVLSPQSQGSS